MKNKKVTVSADGSTASVADAQIADIATTVISTDSAVTGLYGLAQRVGLVVGGMMAQKYRDSRSINIFTK